MYHGQTGFILSDYHFAKGHGKKKIYENVNIKNIQVKFSSNQVLYEAQKLLTNVNNKTEPIFNKATFEVFDCNNHIVRALIGIGMGCDVFPSGISQIGPAFFHSVSKYNKLVLLESNVIAAKLQFDVEKMKRF